MKQILCFGDSNTWGLNAETGTELLSTLLETHIPDAIYKKLEEGIL
ncbi:MULTISPECIES: hypothetical protein [Clostridia]|nr:MULTISPECIES: hypothetical protein [Clostridia]